MDIHDRQPRSFGDIGVSATLYTAEQVDGIVADAAEEAVSAIPAEVERAVGAMAKCRFDRDSILESVPSAQDLYDAASGGTATIGDVAALVGGLCVAAGFKRSDEYGVDEIDPDQFTTMHPQDVSDRAGRLHPIELSDSGNPYDHIQ